MFQSASESAEDALKLISLPHKVSDSECYVNGIEDILAWKGRHYTDHLLSVIGGMASFAYLKFKRASPPNMVYWGANAKYLVQNLEEIIGFKQSLVEGRTFASTLSKLKEYIDQDTPAVVGALDMFYLHYYPKIYGNQHIPIHYMLVVGYDDNRQSFLVQDCGRSGVQEVSYDEMLKPSMLKCQE